jgi:signal transduction histidine kinase
MPRETVSFASAINRLIERVGNLVQSQKILASAAHELRTPLAVMLLELEKIDHPRARRLDADVTGMTRSVNRLLVLARLEATQQPPELVDVDLGAVATEIACGHGLPRRVIRSTFVSGSRRNCAAIQPLSARLYGTF